MVDEVLVRCQRRHIATRRALAAEAHPQDLISRRRSDSGTVNVSTSPLTVFGTINGLNGVSMTKRGTSDAGDRRTLSHQPRHAFAGGTRAVRAVERLREESPSSRRRPPLLPFRSARPRSWVTMLSRGRSSEDDVETRIWGTISRRKERSSSRLRAPVRQRPYGANQPPIPRLAAG